jgi:ABC-2 type transport system ATP-binding protein
VLDLSVTTAPQDHAGSLLDALTAVAGVARGEWISTPPNGSAESARKLPLYLAAEPATTLAPLVTTLDRRQAHVSDVHIGQTSLEDVFINLTGRGLR